MVNKILLSVSILISSGTFSAVSAQKTSKPDLKFIDDIEVTIEPGTTSSVNRTKPAKPEVSPLQILDRGLFSYNRPATGIEKVSALQLKYSVLLNTDVEQIQNTSLFSIIDSWYGTPYRYGGSTKNGIDCSAFVQALYSGVHTIELPRTANSQYKIARPVSRTEIREGDLVFFNTTGGISHVGYYLQNNKFVHAASSGGVMISDLYDEYWVKRFVAVGRIEGATVPTILSQP
jgi:lipoprotein Spr